MRWRELAHRHLSNAWRNLPLNKLAMANSSLSRNPALNINREPMLQIFRDRHLRRINIRPFIATIKKSV
jgi:hypothetical protein